jgi:hypothetical protein
LPRTRQAIAGALEAGTNPALVQQWITQVRAEKAGTGTELRQLTGGRTMTHDAINDVVDPLTGVREPSPRRPKSSTYEFVSDGQHDPIINQIYTTGD